jgi:hypothetical protein
MSNMKPLTFTSTPTKLPNNPKLTRRQRLIERLNEQLQLAQNPRYMPTRKRREVAADGSRKLVEYPRSIKPWWVADGSGNLVLTVSYGLKTLEFEKSICTLGKADHRPSLASGTGSPSTIVTASGSPWRTVARRDPLRLHRNRLAGAGSTLNPTETLPKDRGVAHLSVSESKN